MAEWDKYQRNLRLGCRWVLLGRSLGVLFEFGGYFLGRNLAVSVLFSFVFNNLLGSCRKF